MCKYRKNSGLRALYSRPGLSLTMLVGLLGVCSTGFASTSHKYQLEPFFEAIDRHSDSKVRYISRNTSAPVVIEGAGFGVLDLDNKAEMGFKLLNANKAVKWKEVATGGSATIRHFQQTKTGLTQVRLRPLKRVIAGDIYPGIDLEYRFQQDNVELDYIVEAGADYQQIRIRPQNGQRLFIDKSGQLHLTSSQGRSFVQKAPFSWQDIEGVRRVVESRWVLLADGSAGFQLGEYLVEHPIVIDPVISYSGFIGGIGTTGSTGKESVRSIALDGSENIIIAGSMFNGSMAATDATTNPDIGHTRTSCISDPETDNYDAFVAKYNSVGVLQWMNYLGGSCNEGFRDVYVDATDVIYVTGITVSEDFPIVNAINNNWSPGYLPMDDGSFIPLPDAIFAVFDSAGALSRSSYLGGSGGDYGRSIIADDVSNIWIAGNTSSANFKTFDSGVLQPSAGGESDAFVISIKGSSVTGTYLGGNNDDFVSRMVRDTSTNPATYWLTGITQSATFPMPESGPGYKGYSSSDETCGRTEKDLINDKRACQDAYVINLSEDFTTLNAGTFLGGSGDDRASDLSVQSDGIYVIGATESSGVKLDVLTYVDSNGQVITETYDGSPLGNSPELAEWLARFPLYKPLQRWENGAGTGDGLGDTGSQEAFLTKLDLTLTNLMYSTFLRGSATDSAVALDILNRTTPARREIFILGQTESSDFFPLYASLQSKPINNANFFMRLVEPDSLGRLCSVPLTTGSVQEVPTECPSAANSLFSVMFGSEGTNVPYSFATSATGSYSVVAGVVLPISGTTDADYPILNTGQSLLDSYGGAESGGAQEAVLTRFDHNFDTGGADLKIEFTQQPSGSVTRGSEVQYKARITALSGSYANTQIVIQRPLSVNLVSSSGECRQVNTALYCKIGALTAPGSFEVSFTFRTRYRSGVTITASAQSWSPDADLSNNNVTSSFSVVDPPNRAQSSWLFWLLILPVLVYRASSKATR